MSIMALIIDEFARLLANWCVDPISASLALRVYVKSVIKEYVIDNKLKRRKISNKIWSAKDLLGIEMIKLI